MKDMVGKISLFFLLLFTFDIRLYLSNPQHQSELNQKKFLKHFQRARRELQKSNIKLGKVSNRSSFTSPQCFFIIQLSLSSSYRLNLIEIYITFIRVWYVKTI